MYFIYIYCSIYAFHSHIFFFSLLDFNVVVFFSRLSAVAVPSEQYDVIFYYFYLDWLLVVHNSKLQSAQYFCDSGGLQMHKCAFCYLLLSPLLPHCIWHSVAAMMHTQLLFILSFKCIWLISISRMIAVQQQPTHKKICNEYTLVSILRCIFLPHVERSEKSTVDWVHFVNTSSKQKILHTIDIGLSHWIELNFEVLIEKKKINNKSSGNYELQLWICRNSDPSHVLKAISVKIPI